MNFFRDLLGIKKEAKVKEQIASLRTPAAISETFENKYGKDWLEFLPETIRQLLKEDFKITDEVLINKILATQVALTNGDLEHEWDMFEKVVMAFNDTIPTFQVMEVPNMSELNWGYTAIKNIRPSFDLEHLKPYLIPLMVEAGLMWSPWMDLYIGDHEIIKDLWDGPIKETDDLGINIQLDKLDIIKRYIESWNR